MTTTLSLNSTKALGICLIALFLVNYSYGQGKGQNYYRFLDSVNVYIDDYYKKASVFLDSIPLPLEISINGRIAEYYSLKALIHDGNNESAELYQSYLLALKHAKNESNYKIASEASLELFVNSYYFKRDTTTYRYLESAKEYLRLSKDEYGLLKINQTYAYAKFLNGEHEACNNLILNHIDTYKNVKEDGYYYMFATYMLTSNYIYLGDLIKANAFFDEFKTLENDSTIVKYNYLSFKAGINSCFADIYFQEKQLDSTLYHLNELEVLRNYMADDVVKYYFKLKADVYKSSGKLNESEQYIDSLLIFEEKMFKSIVYAGHQMSDYMAKAETEVEAESKKKVFNGWLVVVLILILVVAGIYYAVYYRKHRYSVEKLKNQEGNFSYLKSNNEKLVVKVHGLEKYINEIKNDVKEIAKLDETCQKEKIREFYSNLHHNSSTLLDKSENHLELVNDLNVDFFNKIQKRHPQLNKSEVIICYYLFIGFKNKEIAVFLNTSVRAIESKRYRISKKIEYTRNDITLIEHLKETFKDARANN